MAAAFWVALPVHRSRLTLLCGCAAAWTAAGAQPDQLPEAFTNQKPDVLIEVRAAPTGAQYVTVSVVAEGYPADLLQEQCEAIGRFAGSNVRGLNLETIGTGVSPGGRPLSFLKAHFATDNLVDTKTGLMRLVPFAKAFAGARSPFTISCLAVTYLGFAAGPQTLSQVESPSASVVGISDPSVPLVEYRINLKSQIPAEIAFSESPLNQTIPANTTSTKKVSYVLIAGVFGAAALTGLLVYFALRPRRGGRGKTHLES